jgi:hypothetical protein
MSKARHAKLNMADRCAIAPLRHLSSLRWRNHFFVSASAMIFGLGTFLDIHPRQAPVLVLELLYSCHQDDVYVAYLARH